MGIFRHNRVGYLCGAPRVSTLSDAEASGPRAHVVSFIRALESLGWKVKPFILGDHLPRKYVRHGSEHLLSKSLFSRLFADLVRLGMGSFAARMAWQQLRGQVDWVYERSNLLQSLGWIFKQHGIPWVLETNSPIFHEARFDRKATVLSRLALQIEARAYRECDLLVCVSETLRDIIVKKFEIPRTKTLVLSNGVDTRFFDPALHEPKRLFPEFTIGFVGTLSSWQGLEVLLHALRELQNEGVDMSLVVVGDGLMRSSWEKLTRELNLTQKVAFVGRVSWKEVPSHILGFDVGYCGPAFTSWGEMYHSPLKLYEYMSMGKPVIASGFEEAKRLVKEGETGFLFQLGNKQDLKQALLRAQQSRELLAKMGQKARADVVSNHDWTVRANSLITHLERRLS